jgi:nickel/cobalt transporter (NicO) family protein
MWQIFIGSLFLSAIHALIPNHWAPLVTLSKTEKWSRGETLFATLLTGLSHTASTLLIGIVVGVIGIKLSESYSIITKFAAPAILFVIGVIYIIADLRHGHSHSHSHDMTPKASDKKTKWTVLFTLCIAMFLTPCVEIEAYYFQAAAYGWMGILIVSAVYLFITLLFTLFLVHAGLKGITKFNLHFLEHHERLITGIVLIILAVIAYFA